MIHQWCVSSWTGWQWGASIHWAQLTDCQWTGTPDRGLLDLVQSMCSRLLKVTRSKYVTTQIPFDLILKWFCFPTDSDRNRSPQGCTHRVPENSVNSPTEQVHQTVAVPGVRPLPKPGPSHALTVASGHQPHSQNVQTFQNPNLSPSEGPAPSTLQDHLQVSSHLGHHMSPNQDQRVVGTPAGQRVSNIPPRSDQRLDHSLQQGNLSVPRFNFVVKGENLGLSDDSPALSFGSSSQIPDSAVLGQLNSRHLAQTSTFKGPDRLSDNVWHSGVMTNQPSQGPLIMANQDLQRLNVDLRMQALTQQHAANKDFSLDESSGRNQIGKTEESSGYRPQGPYDPSQLYTVFPSQDQHSPDQASREDTYTRSFNTVVSDFSVDKPRSSSTDPASSNQNLKRPGSVGRRNTEMVQSRVQNIHVKPPSKFISSGYNFHNKASLQQANSQIYESSKYSMSQNTDGSRWTLKKLQGHRDSNTRPESLSKEKGVPTLEQVVHRNQTAATLLANVFPSWQTHRPTSNEQKRVQSATEIGTGGEESASTLRNILQPAGTDQKCFWCNLVAERHQKLKSSSNLNSNVQTSKFKVLYSKLIFGLSLLPAASRIRVRPVAGLSSRLQTRAQSQMQKLQRPTTSRNSYHSITAQSNSLVKAMEHQTNYRSVEGADSNGLCGSGGSDKQVHTTSDCRGQYGASLHQDINPGTVNKDSQIALFINDLSRYKMVKFKL